MVSDQTAHKAEVVNILAGEIIGQADELIEELHQKQQVSVIVDTLNEEDFIVAESTCVVICPQQKRDLGDNDIESLLTRVAHLSVGYDYCWIIVRVNRMSLGYEKVGKHLLTTYRRFDPECKVWWLLRTLLSWQKQRQIAHIHLVLRISLNVPAEAKLLRRISCLNADQQVSFCILYIVYPFTGVFEAGRRK